MSVARTFRTIRTIVLDFDGVLHRYDSGWFGPRVVVDEPVDDAIDFLLDLLADGWDVVVYSTRSSQWGGRRTMKRWLRYWAERHFMEALKDPEGDAFDRWERAGFIPPMEWAEQEDCKEAGKWITDQIRFPRSKPPALVTLDDRAICFQGRFPDLEALNNFRPWNR